MELQNFTRRRHVRTVLTIGIFLLWTSACASDPLTARNRLFQKAERYREKGLLRQAEILYQNAVRLDPKSGEPYYRLGVVQTQRATFGAAIGSLRRAVELLPEGKERVDARVRLAKLLSIYLESVHLAQPVIEEVDRLAGSLLEKGRDEFHGRLLKGSLAALQARRFGTLNLTSEAESALRRAEAELEAADAIHPADPDTVLVLARVRTVLGETKRAESALRALLQQHPESVAAWQELYKVLSSQPGRAPDSADVLRAGIRSNPRQPSFLVMLAAHYLSRGRRSEAAEVLNRLKASFQRDPAVFEEAGTLYARFGDLENALRQYEEAAASLPRQKLRFQKLAVGTLMSMGRRQEASVKLAEMLQEAPKDVDARVLHAQIRFEDGDVKGATAELEQLAGEATGNLNLQYNLARVHLANGRFEEARIRLGEALRLSPGHEPSRLLAAEIHLQSGEYLKALMAAEDVLGRNPSSIPARLLRAGALQKLTRYAESRKQLEAILSQAPNHPAALFRLAGLEAAEGKFAAAEAIYRRSYEANPLDASGLSAIVEIAMARGNPSKAMEVLQTESRRFPKRMDLKILLGDTARRLSRCDVALPVYQQAAKELMEVHTLGLIEYRQGLCLLSPEHAKEALTHLERARELLPKNSDIHRHLGYVYDLLGRPQDSQASYEKSLALDGENPVTLNNLAFQIAEHGGDLDLALTYAQRARSRMPDKPEIADTIAWIYLKKNLVAESLGIFSDLVEKNQNNPEFRYHYAFALLKSGDRGRARLELQAALAAGAPLDLKNRILELLDSGD